MYNWILYHNCTLHIAHLLIEFMLMQTNNLYHYIKTWAFLSAVTTIPDCIIWESIPDLSHLGADRSKTEHVALQTLWYDFRAEGSVISHIKDKKNIFLILDTLSIESCKDILPLLSSHHCKVINLGVGISWVQNKHSLEVNDIAIVWSALPIFEPIDTKHFLQMINADSTIYIRITHDEIADELFSWEHSSLYAERDIPMTSFWYTGIWWTILIQPSMLIMMTQVLQYVQTTNGIWYDLFVHTWPREVYSEKLIQSLHHTGKLIVIHDQAAPDALRDSEQKIFKASGLQWEIAVAFKNPLYEKITTILPEYMYEQVWYSTDSLAHYLLSLN